MEQLYRILVINTGSTSTKTAVYENERQVLVRTVAHSDEEIVSCRELQDQIPMRTKVVWDMVREGGFAPSDFHCIMCRGGMLTPIKAGAYAVNDAMVEFLREGAVSPHASNLAALIGRTFAEEAGIPIPVYIYDAPSSAELSEMAQVTGFPEITRHSICHALNSRAVAHKVAEEQFGKKYEDMRFVVAHLGGGISFSAHVHGKIVDAIADDEGPFSPERSGAIPLLGVLDLCYSGKYTYREMKKKVRGEGGMRSHLGTSSCQKIEKMIADGDKHAELIYRAQAYQIAKGTGLICSAMKGQIDAIILTGGMAHSKLLVEWVKEYISFLAPVIVCPGENELEALAMGGLRLLRGEETAREFQITVS